MRKIHITESQWKALLESECSYPLNVKGDDGRPDNFTEYEVATDNTDKDAPLDVTISDTLKRSKEGWFGMNRYPAMSRLPESEELDNVENSGFGEKSDKYINNVANAGNGKMVNNVANEINSNTRGSRNNTNQVRLSRLEKYRTTNPELFKKNGGEKMVSILKGQVNAQSNTHKQKHATDIRTQSPSEGVPFSQKTIENDGAYYFG